MKKIIKNLIDFLHIAIVILFDWIMLYACFYAGHKLWIASPLRIKQEIPEFRATHVFFYIILITAVLIWGGTYKRQSSTSHIVRLKDIVKFSVLGFGFAVLVSFFTKMLLVARLQAILILLFMIPGVMIERLIVDKLWIHFIVRRFLVKKIVIYGAGNTGKRLAKSINKNPKLGYQAIGFFDDQKSSNTVVMADALPVLGGKERFIHFLKTKRRKIDEVHIAMPAASNRVIKQVMNICDTCGVPFKFVPNLNDLMLHRLDQEQLDGIPLFGINDLSISFSNRIVKRIFDIAASIMVLLLGLPFIGIVSVIIKRDSSGPAFFKQKRIGYKGREFMMYKFRTMFEHTPRYFWHPHKNTDPRVTRFGMFLRKTSLDEFPQFWNVLKGDMSIVGPRPEMPFIVKTYNIYQKERLNAKPGITGLWQISGDRSLPIHENIDHDLYYIAHQSFLLDIVIIMQTVWFAVIRGVGAK